VDEAMPCSPDCELLGEDGEMLDYRRCLDAGCDVIMLEELRLDRETAERWQRLLDMPSVDFGKENIDRDCTIETWSVEFENGHVADLKLCSGDSNLFLDAVLFEPCNIGLQEEFVPDCPDSILGDHIFAPFEGRVNYVMRISLKTE